MGKPEVQAYYPRIPWGIKYWVDQEHKVGLINLIPPVVLEVLSGFDDISLTRFLHSMISKLNKTDSEMSDGISQTGPWRVEVWSGEKVAIQSEDINHHTSLLVNGDFSSLNEKIQYAETLADKLNDS